MPTYFDAATVERARVLVETTVRTLEDIAVEVGVSVQTLRNWIKKHGWRRPPAAPRAVPKLPPEKEEPARRLFESGASARNLAALLSCSESYVHRLASQRGWTRLQAAAAEEEAGPPSEALDAIATALGDPALSPRDYNQLVLQALALTTADVIAGRHAGIERRIDALERLVERAKSFPEDAAFVPCTCDLSPEDKERQREAMIDALMRRWGHEGEEPVDPFIAAVAGAAP